MPPEPLTRGLLHPRSPFCSLSSTEFVDPPPEKNSWVRHCFILRRILVKNFANRPAILNCVLKILFTVSMHMLSCYLRRSCDFPSTCFPVMRSYPTVQYCITCEPERNFFNPCSRFYFQLQS